MAKPYIFWDPSWNASLITAQANGPLVITLDDSPTQAQLDSFKKMVALTAVPKIFDGTSFSFARTVEFSGGVTPNKGVSVSNYDWLPDNLTFPAPGPDPYDLSDLYVRQFRYANLGWRIALRGWAGTMYEGGLNGEYRIKWSDETLREQFSSRAKWTGLMLGAFNTYAERTDHVLDMLHGKREADADWSHHSGHLDRVPSPGPEVVTESLATQNGITTGEVRVVVSGGAPLWNISMQYKSGGSWITVGSPLSVDLRSNMAPAPPDEIGLIVSLFDGITKEYTGVPEPWSLERVCFSEISVPQFEPWVPDLSSWSQRGWDQHWEWLTGSTAGYDMELRRPVTDLMHVPVGADRGPEDLRYSDPELGICSRLNADTSLFAVGNSDARYIEIFSSEKPEPLATCDAYSYGYKAPFAFYMRARFDAMETWGEDRAIVSFGDILNASPTPTDNGIGLYWKSTGATSGKFVVRIFDSGLSDWDDLEYDIPDVSEISDRQIDIGFAWTGIRGTSIGHDNYELRIVVDGLARASKINGGLLIRGTENARIGSYSSHKGFQGLFRYATVFGDPVTDQDMHSSFQAPEEPFSNPSFELPADSNRPGEAKDWNWYSFQQGTEWAEFNTQDPDYEQWQTAMEEFGPGWFDPDEWFDDISEAVLASALFNAGVTLYESTMEEFALWLVWSESGYVTGTPWRDDWIFLRPDQDVKGPYLGPTGFNGWYDQAAGSNKLPLEMEQLGEAWGNDPFSTSVGPLWHPGVQKDGAIKGSALTFPLTIPPDKNRMCVWADAIGIVPIVLTVGEYADATSLAAMIEAFWNTKVGDIGLQFTAWTDGDDSGISFGWDGTSTVAHAAMFGVPEETKGADARAILGLIGFGPNGMQGKIKAKAWMLDYVAGTDPEDVFLLDHFSFMSFVIVTDTYNGTYPLQYEHIEAIFDTGIPDPTVVERFTLVGWFGPGSAWKPSYLPGDLADAMFDSGVNDMEEFIPANWPEEVWT